MDKLKDKGILPLIALPKSMSKKYISPKNIGGITNIPQLNDNIPIPPISPKNKYYNNDNDIQPIKKLGFKKKEKDRENLTLPRINNRFYLS